MHKRTIRRHKANRRSRGSVLVIVVAILMLLALMGTAYIATVRLDRYIAFSHMQAATDDSIRDGFVEQVSQTVQRLILRDAMPPFDDNHPPVDSPRWDGWLGDRLPSRVPAANNMIVPMWRNFTRQLNKSNWADQFMSPLTLLSVPPFNYSILMRLPEEAGGPPLPVSIHPTSITITYPLGYSDERYRGLTRTFPAVDFINPLNGVYLLPDGTENPGKASCVAPRNDQNPYRILAGDADGDGIADSVLFRLSGIDEYKNGRGQGITFYAAVRIIDNSSAINVNTAWSRDYEFLQGTPTARNRAFFTSNIGLRELFTDSNGDSATRVKAQMAVINQWRMGFGPSGWNQGNPEQPFSASVKAYDDFNKLRSDFQFTTESEALFMQLGRRIINPGRNEISGGTAAPYVAFPETDAAHLAYRYMMLQPQSDASGYDLGSLEDRMAGVDTGDPLGDAIVRSAPNYVFRDAFRFKYFAANQADLWFRWLDFDDPNLSFTQTSFYGEPETTQQRFRPLRPLLTTYNPVSATIVAKTTGIQWNRQQPEAMWLYPGQVRPMDTAQTPMPIFDPNAIVSPPPMPPNLPEGAFVRDRSTGKFYMYRGSQVTNGPLNANTPIQVVNAWEPQPVVSGRVKTNPNTAGFPELWRAYHMVMSGDHRVNRQYDATITPFEKDRAGFISTDPYYGMATGGTQVHPLHMFKSVLRDPRSPSTLIMPDLQMIALRSAMAALNTISLRTWDHPNFGTTSAIIPSRKITLYDISKTPAEPMYEATLYGIRPQPFITEVYANSDDHDYGSGPSGQLKNENGYVAIELYNPFSIPISLNGWKLVSRLRTGTTYDTTTPTYTDLYTFGNVVLQPNTRLIIDNFEANSSNGAARYRPPSSGLDLVNDPPVAGVTYIKVPRLASNANGGVIGTSSTDPTKMGRELIIMRPNGSGSANLGDMVPVDQYDFTGLVVASKSSDGNAHSWSYIRPNTDTKRWDCVYPGRYVGTNASGGSPRYTGTQEVDYEPSKFDPALTPQQNRDNKAIDPWNPTGGTSIPAPFQPGDSAKQPNPSPGIGIADNRGSYTNTCTINLEAVANLPAGQYPFGGFARNGDLLQVPFIGSYVIKRVPANSGGAKPYDAEHPGPVDVNVVLEANAISIDSAFAEDGYSTNNNSSDPNLREQVGRFAPMLANNANQYRAYDWATSLFDYFDVHTPSNDYLPDVDPAAWATLPQPVSNENTDPSLAYANNGQEDGVGLHGRINIWTAPSKILSMLPLVPNADGSINVQKTEAVARAIVDARNVAGRDDLLTLFDLQRIPQFRSEASNQLATPIDSRPNLTTGGYTTGAGNGEVDAVYQMLSRISNLVTTRSDSFTVYIVVQAWQQADTRFPSLDWEQRKAFIVDRSAVPAGGAVKIIPVATD